VPVKKYARNPFKGLMTRFSHHMMSAKVGTILRIAALLALASTQALSQFSVDGKPVLLSHSARGEGLGNSYVSEFRDVGAMYWNPASLSYVSLPQAVLGGYYVWEGSQFTGYAAVPMRPLKEVTVALGLTTTSLGDSWTEPYFVNRSIDLGSSFQISQSLSLGFLFHLQQSAIAGSSIWTSSSSIGAFYAPTSGLQYGASLEGLGTGVDYSRYQLHTVRPLTKILRMGTSYTWPLFKSRQYVTFSISGEKHFGIDKLHYFVAMEVAPFAWLDLRIGYIQKPDSAVDYTSGARYGVGIHTEYITLDYCISPSISAQQHHQATILVRFR
jgi:hypothetical protein